MQDLHPQRVGRHCLQQRFGVEQGLGTPFRLLQLLAGGNFVQQELRQRQSPVDLLGKSIGAAFADKAVGVVLGRQKQETHTAIVGRMRQTGVQRAPRGLAPGRVAIETEHHRIGLAKQLLHVNRGTSRAQGRHSVRKTELRQRHHVHITFDHQRIAFFTDRQTRLKQAV